MRCAIDIQPEKNVRLANKTICEFTPAMAAAAAAAVVHCCCVARKLCVLLCTHVRIYEYPDAIMWYGFKINRMNIQ